MDQTQLALPRSFCWNKDCPDYGKIDHGNIRKFGRTAKANAERLQPEDLLPDERTETDEMFQNAGGKR